MASLPASNRGHRAGRPARDSAGDRGVLELVEDRPLDLVEHALDRAHGVGGIAVGSSSRRTNTAASPTTNVGTPHTVCESTYDVCSFSTVASGRPLSTSAHTASTSAPAAARTGVRSSRSLICAGRRRGGARTARGGRRGTRPAACRARRSTTCRASSPVSDSGRSQTGGSPSATWAWPSENGRNVTSQSAPARSPVDDVVVDDAGVRAAVVVGQSEAAGHGVVNESTVSDRFPTAPDDAPGAEPERGAGGHPGDDVGRVVDAHVGPAGGDDGGERSTTAAPLRRPSHAGEQRRP